MEDCGTCKFPVMISFHNSTSSLDSFKLVQVEKTYTFERIMKEEFSDIWDEVEESMESIKVKVSAGRSGSYDKFGPDNTVNLAAKILKTDVIWVIFEKISPPVSTLPVRNAFELLKTAANSKGLPDPIINPWNQKQELFNKVVKFLKDQEILFEKSDCHPRIKNRKTGAATNLVHDISDILWRIGQSERQFRSSGLWGNVPELITELSKSDHKSKDPILITQLSAKTFATKIRETASKALMASTNIKELKLCMLRCADLFVKYSEYLKAHAESFKKKTEAEKSISSATEAVIQQISNREKVSLLKAGTKPLKNKNVIEIFEKIMKSDHYEPVNISTVMPTNPNSRSTILHRDLPQQAPQRLVLWTFDNYSTAPQSIFAFTVDPEDDDSTILTKTNKLKARLQNLQMFFYPSEFYQQFYDQIGSVTGISPRDLKLVCGMVMGDDRKFDGPVRERFEEAVMSGDADYVYDMRYFNGREIKYKEFLEEFRVAVQEYMVEDRGRHDTQYDGTVVSKVSFGFSLRQMFRSVCDKVREKNPNCPLPTSEGMVSRYLIPRTKAAAESACRSEPLIPLKLAMQQKIIDKPNVDAHYNAALYKYIRSFAVELGPDLVCMVGWDDKTGVDVGEPEQPTVATQHAGKSWVHADSPVGEGQHSFHKTNLTPSVRLVHEIGDSIDASFYRGLPQLVVKDAIFQPSSSARHATELLQMLQAKPELMKPVQILTNDGGCDHTIRHERNIVAMLALFLRQPNTLLLMNFQMAAYRSAYHPVEKLNCILNLAWNGVALSREVFEDPVLEKAFGQCASMAETRTKAEKHPGIKIALKKSLEPSISILEERAKQAALKENEFEVFKPATDQDIKDFLNILLEIDEEFDVERFLDKKKPYHFSLKIKAYLDQHLTSTHYSLTFMKYASMSKVFLSENFPEYEWPRDLSPVPCPVVDQENPHRYLSYDKVQLLANKDFSDMDRPGKLLKTPSNIPFIKSKQRALFGAKLILTCEVCSKPRVVYLERKPKEGDLKAAVDTLKNIRYICGARLSSFGRSLAVMEEIVGASAAVPEIQDEIENELSNENPAGDDHASFVDIVDELEEEQVKRKKKMIIESDEDSASEADIAVLDLLSNPNQQLMVSEGSSENEDDSNSDFNDDNNEIEAGSCVIKTSFCSFCAQIDTSHKCKVCAEACCNLCNTVTEVDEITDVVCPRCKPGGSKEESSELKTRKRGRPLKNVRTGSILIPLVKKKRGRPAKLRIVSEDVTVTEEANNNVDVTLMSKEEVPTQLCSLTELRILAPDNILKKLFVDEALTCESSIETHMYDILLTLRKPLPCSYCGEKEEQELFSKLTDENFPLCLHCKGKGRGAGARRKGRKVQPAQVKQKKKVCVNRKKRMGQLI